LKRIAFIAAMLVAGTALARRSTHRTSGRGLPPGGKYQNQKENESEGKTPDGRM
jgi:hypothetical protein